MSVVKLILILIFLKLNFFRLQSKETTCLINGKKSLNVVNERFLSFSIDPATLLNGFNGSSASIKLAQHFSPAFIRIAGPSTQFMQLSEDGKTPLLFFGNTIRFAITPERWESLNNWIKNANLMPIFAINDKNTLKGAWQPKSIFPLLGVNEENNFTCYWQLGHDCKRKSLLQYKEDLMKLKFALDEYPSSRQISKIVGSNLQPCISNKNPELARKSLEALDNVADAVMWEQDLTSESFVGNIFRGSPIPIWLIVPKATQPVTFSSSLLWAKQMGEAAQAGYEAIFRQPRFYELFTDTPVYWVSLVYKTFMGRNVLEVRSNSIPDANINIYAHCTKKQENYSKRGSITVFVINNSSSEHTTSLRVVNSYPRSIEVQSYILTSDGDDSTNIYLNGEILTIDELRNKQLQFTPNTRRMRVNPLLNLISPAKSVGFFVLPGARVSVCIRREDDDKLKKFQQDQDIDSLSNSAEDLSVQIPKEYKNKLYRLMPQKVEEDEEFHQETTNILKKPFPALGKLKEKNNFTGFRQQLITKTLAPEQKENGEKKAKLEIIFTERPSKNHAIPNNVKTIELELTNEEVKKILQDRAKSSIAEENIDITSRELEDILREAAKTTLDDEYTTIAALNKRKRFAVFDFLRRTNDKTRSKGNKNRQRTKRGINMELLSRKRVSDKPTKTFRNNQDVRASVRRDGETSEELLIRNEASEEKVVDVYAELANSWENLDGSNKFHGASGRSRTNTRGHTGKASEESHCAKYVDERIKFLTEPEELDSFLEDDFNSYYGIHENFKQFHANHRPNFNSEVQNSEAFIPGYNGKREDKSSFKVARVELWEADKVPQEKIDGKVNLTQIQNWETKTLLYQNNKQTGDLMPFNTAKHQCNEKMNKRVLLPSNNAKRIEDPLSYEMVHPRMTKMRRTDTFFPEKNGNASSLTNEVWGAKLFAERSKPQAGNTTSFRMVKSRINNDNLQGNTFSEANIPVRPQLKKESWENDSFYKKSKPQSESVPYFKIANPKNSTEVQKTEILASMNDENLSFINTETTVSYNQPLETTVFSQENNEKMPADAKIPLSNEIPKSDDIPSMRNKNVANPVAKTVTPRANENVWGIDTFSRENNKRTENPSSFNLAESSLNNEIPRTKNISSENNKEASYLLKINNTTVNVGHEKLADYFCDPKNDFAVQNYARNRYKPKYKRDVSDITRNDIRNYKKFMMDQLRLMRKARNNNRPQPEKISRVPLKDLTPRSKSKLVSSADFDQDNLSGEETLGLMVEESQEQENSPTGEFKLAEKLEKFRQNRKRLFDRIRERKSQQLEDVQNDLTNLRSKRTSLNDDTKKVHKQNAILKQYKSQIVRKREWKPQDIVKVKKAPTRSVEVVDTQQFLHRTAPFIKNKFKEAKRQTRSVGADAYLVQNTVNDCSLRKVEKISKFLRNAKNESLHQHIGNLTRITLPSKNSTKNQAVIVTAQSGVTPVISTKTSETTTLNSSVEVVTTCRTLNEKVIPNKTEKVGASLDNHAKTSPKVLDQEVPMTTIEAEESTFIPPNLVDMIMVAVNSTVNKFVHLGEEIAKQLTF